MIVDTSALIAIVLREPGYERILDTLVAVDVLSAAPTLVEAKVMLAARLGPAGPRRIGAILTRAAVDVVDFDERQADAAIDAYRDFGKGSGHPARLNLGDSFSYALAYVRDEPLLYLGDDFSHTDIRSALDEYTDEGGED